ncbi:MAG: DinB family protein, partial [Acidobacteria bacterium]|nr:DinB family protein [Acidobacteriota bacterium]
MMEFDLEKATQLLRQTPYTLQRMLEGLSDEWTIDGGSE